MQLCRPSKPTADTQASRVPVQLSSSRAAELEAALLAVLDSSQLRQPSASLQLLVRLLHAARPESFSGFRAFARWRAGACDTLAAVLAWSTRRFRLQQARPYPDPLSEISVDPCAQPCCLDIQAARHAMRHSSSEVMPALRCCNSLADGHQVVGEVHAPEAAIKGPVPIAGEVGQQPCCAGGGGHSVAAGACAVQGRAAPACGA